MPRDRTGLHHALRICLGTSILWFLLQYIGDTNPLWAIISLVLVTETHLQGTWLNFKARMIHTIIGCIIGFLSLLLFQGQSWTLPMALTATVLVCNYLTHVPLGWRVAPVTAAIIISAGMTQKTAIGGIDVAAHRTIEVLIGSTMALIITWIVSRFWREEDMSAPKDGGKE